MIIIDKFNVYDVSHQYKSTQISKLKILMSYHGNMYNSKKQYETTLRR